MNNLRNVAIIAHVDHGKTTLVDAMLKQTQTKLSKEFADTTLIMDSNELEKERGITIFFFFFSVNYKGTKINIVDTPGHADFGGEVERVLKLVDGCLLLVDAKEGPMPQTRFVLKEALNLGLKIIVVINKLDKLILRSPDGDLRIDKTAVDKAISKTFDLFIELGADEESAYFPVIYASAKNGVAGSEPDLNRMKNIIPIFDAILRYIPSPPGDPEKPLQVLVTSISSDNFKGRIATGRIVNGSIAANQEVIQINRDGLKNRFRLTSLSTFEGLEKVNAEKAVSGDIIALSGIPEITIGETVTDDVNTPPLPLLSIEEPTVKMTFGVNTSPFAGLEGEFKTSRQLRERLRKAADSDVALKVSDSGIGWEVCGRGELHLAILIERLRREGFEFQVSRPTVIEKINDGKLVTPYERVFIEVHEIYQGIVMQKMGLRHGQLQDVTKDNGIVCLEFIIATKELFGYRSEFITDTKGLGIMNAIFLEFREDNGQNYQRDNGSLVVHADGLTKLYGLTSIQSRGNLFIEPGVSVYKGQVIGQNARSGDISVNVCKEKQQTNHRSSGEGVSEHFNAPRLMALEDALEYINDTELVEVTPKNVRIRKIDLNGVR